MTENFLGTIDWAAVAIWLFWLFFAGLIFYIQRENMREGYPLERDEGHSQVHKGRRRLVEQPEGAEPGIRVEPPRHRVRTQAEERVQQEGHPIRLKFS